VETVENVVIRIKTTNLENKNNVEKENNSCEQKRDVHN
jgi:hypothetical protein